MNHQKEMARNARVCEASMNIQNEALLKFTEESKFTGYTDYQTDTYVIALIKGDKLVDELTDEGYVILKETPFYAEMGGQVSDTGYIYNENTKCEVIDMITSPNKQHVHIVNVEEGSIKVGDKVTARINVKRRESIEKNHSATHLMHKSLKEALDYDVTQAGSKVDEYGLRFDFTYPKKITDEDIILVEDLVNEKIRTNTPAVIEEMSLSDAKKTGADALFDEKYGDIVRVVTLYDSKELCGGTHVKNVGDINRFAIKSYESKGANVYRIEGVTDTLIEKELFDVIKPYNDEMVKLLTKAKGIVDDANSMDIDINFNVNIDNSNPTCYKDIIFNRNEVAMVRNKVKDLEKEFNAKKESKILSENKDFSDISKVNDIEYIVKRVNNYDLSILKTLVDNAFNKMTKGIIFVANVKDSSVNYLCKSNCDLSAGELIKDASIKSNGNGGGSRMFGQGGGTNSENVDMIIDYVKDKVENI